VKVHCDSLQGLAHSHCAGKLDVLTDDVCDFLQSMTTDFTPLSPDDTFLPLGADTSVPDTYIISVAEVTDSLSRIKTNIAAVPDEIPNWILRDYATKLALAVCAIFNSSQREGIVPQLWKCAHPQRPAANLTHAGIIKMLGAFHLHLDYGHRR